VVRAIAAKADVLVENFRPGVMDRLGLAYETLRASNPRLVYCSVSGFGQTGPDREKPGYDLMMQASSGLMHASAAEGDPPVKVVFPIADIAASLFAGQAILAALYERERTGRGRRIDVSLLEAMLAAMSTVTSPALITGEPPVRVGTAQPNIVPYQMFHCLDAAIVAGAPNDRLFERFCEALEHREWLDDPRFVGNANRNRHRHALVSQLESVFRTREAAHWLNRLTALGLPCARVATVLEALANPHLETRGAIANCQHPSLGTLRFVANPMRMDGYTPNYQPPPDLGDHTRSIAEEFFPGRQDS
jgi:formyl-CoA transferase/CoA:oxalate CoA-transferase